MLGTKHKIEGGMYVLARINLAFEYFFSRWGGNIRNTLHEKKNLPLHIYDLLVVRYIHPFMHNIAYHHSPKVRGCIHLIIRL